MEIDNIQKQIQKQKSIQEQTEYLLSILHEVRAFEKEFYYKMKIEFIDFLFEKAMQINDIEEKNYLMLLKNELEGTRIFEARITRLFENRNIWLMEFLKNLKMEEQKRIGKMIKVFRTEKKYLEAVFLIFKSLYSRTKTANYVKTEAWEVDFMVALATEYNNFPEVCFLLTIKDLLSKKLTEFPCFNEIIQIVENYNRTHFPSTLAIVEAIK